MRAMKRRRRSRSPLQVSPLRQTPLLLCGLRCEVFTFLTISPPLPSFSSCHSLLFLATAVVSHTLTRPNRPAPPPPDKRDSTGPTIPASGSFLLPLVSPAPAVCLCCQRGAGVDGNSLSPCLCVSGRLRLYNCNSHIHAICSACHMFLILTLLTIMWWQMPHMFSMFCWEAWHFHATMARDGSFVQSGITVKSPI